METGEYNLKECTLRFATYNIWNDDSGQEKRAARILQELQAVRADVVGLQEVTENFYTNYLCADAAFLHRAFCKYEGEEEGLAILSKYPLTELFFLQTSPEYAYSNALNVLFSVNGLRFSLTDVHLPWDSVRRQEKQRRKEEKREQKAGTSHEAREGEGAEPKRPQAGAGNA